MNWSEALRRPCPRCGAGAAENCVGSRGPRKAHHIERYGDAGPDVPQRRSRTTRCNVEGWIYFIGPVDCSTVKIGWTRHDPEKRLRELQIGNGQYLHVLGRMRGTERTEKALHEVWGHLALRGEWFTVSAALLDYILEVTPEAEDGE